MVGNYLNIKQQQVKTDDPMDDTNSNSEESPKGKEAFGAREVLVEPTKELGQRKVCAPLFLV